MATGKEYKETINANGIEIAIVSTGSDNEYVSLTHIAKF